MNTPRPIKPMDPADKDRPAAPPSYCDEEGHNWHYLGHNVYGEARYICRRCRQESE